MGLSTAKKAAIGIATVVVILGVTAALLGVFLPGLLRPQNTPGNEDVGFFLPASASSQILVVEDMANTRADGQPRILARSYNGNPWEPVPDLTPVQLNIVCNSTGACGLKSNGNYRVRVLDVPEAAKRMSDSALAARLMQQATFGASKAELDRVVSTYGPAKFGDWIVDQMRLPATSHRAYFRQRSHPRPSAIWPTTAGVVTQPCWVDTRWHRYVFTVRDRGRLLTVSTSELSDRYTLRIDGFLRGELFTFFDAPFPGTGLPLTFPVTMRICYVQEGVGGYIQLSRDSGTGCDLWGRNPAIELSIASPMNTYTSDKVVLVPVQGAPAGAVVLKNLYATCTNVSDMAGNSFMRVGNQTFRFDQRVRFFANTPDNPAVIGAGAPDKCSRVEPSFQNRNTCARRQACGNAPQFRSAIMQLNDTTLRAWYTDSRQFVYYMQGMRLEDQYAVSPCRSGFSRWRRTANPCSNPTALDSTTQTTISDALAASSDTNPYVRDITLTGANCNPSTATIGAFVTAGGECFQHVHPDLFSVRDAGRWVDIHPGNAEAMANGGSNPIGRWAASGLAYLQYPGGHEMTRWYERGQDLPIVGRYGDSINFLTLRPNLQTEQMALRVGALRDIPAPTDGGVACGSVNEVSSIPELGHHYASWLSDEGFEVVEMLDNPSWESEFSVLHSNVAIKSADQLRQRVAWTLHNIIPITPIDIDFIQYPEAWTNYYDIFVRHAFGSYLDVLRDVSYNNLMSWYLTFWDNKAYAVSGNYPDENYAREIMQLFSIGLWKLNDDGTIKRAANGNPLPTYTNDDILEYARLWTGFLHRGPRSNTNDYSPGAWISAVDPLYIYPAHRDRFPKTSLDGGYLGDTYPLCDELPPRHYLRAGAVYEYSGDVSIEGATLDGEQGNAGRRGRFTPTSDSQLYAALCAPRADGRCTFPLQVVLPTTLTCTGPQECNAGRVRSVKIVDSVSNTTKYYTYTMPPCVTLTLFQNGQVVRRCPTEDCAQCANPVQAVASPMCCDNSTGNVLGDYGTECLFNNEATDYRTAINRCQALNRTMCPAVKWWWTSFQTACADHVYAWTSETCRNSIQIYFDGRIGLVEPSGNPKIPILRNNSNNVFRVFWRDGIWPTATGNGSCAAWGCVSSPTPKGPSCICNFTVTESKPFASISDLSTAMSSSNRSAVEVIASRCFIGSSPASRFDSTVYRRCTSAACANLGDVVVWLHNLDSEDSLTVNTIFELPPVRRGGRVRHLRNRLSQITIAQRFSFRNPPHFAPLLGELLDTDARWIDYHSDLQWTRQAENEVEALLEHLFEHDNTAPFLAYRFIQQMVTSNPSPRYVKSVVQAFRSGSYGNVQFSGKYGDLGAMVYAVLMDREARTPVLDADPTFGMLRDPFIKLMQLFRTLDYKAFKGREITLSNIWNRIGVWPYRQPSVFSFYLPEFQPAGPISAANLVSPQMQIATTPNLIGFLNGAMALVEDGLSVCGNGFGSWLPGVTCNWNAADQDRADGRLSYAAPPEYTSAQVVDELALLLTANRLNDSTRTILIREYDLVLNQTSNSTQALRHLIKLFINSLEFHTNGFNMLSGSPRPAAPVVPSQRRRFKAVVVVFESGGSDSYNRIVPLSGCASKDLYGEYASVRREAGLNTTQLLPISVPAGSQPCTTFGMHYALPRMRQLYNDGDLAHIANIGALIELLNAEEFNKGSKIIPPSPFSHNVMQRSIQNLRAQDAAAEGVLGRIADTMTAAQWKTALFSFSGRVKMVQGKTPADIISRWSSVSLFDGLAKMRDAIGNMTKTTTRSVFAETYADAISLAIEKTEYLGGLLSRVSINQTFANNLEMNTALAGVAKVIKALATETDTERALFFADMGGFDTHNSYDLQPMWSDLDSAIGKFSDEMKGLGLWDDVVILSASDFGRTLAPNGKGTDHAWGSHQFIAGGKVRGSQILGTYPDILTDDSPLSLGRGRFLPTLGYESVWQGIAEWFDVPTSEMSNIIPNARNFPDSAIFTRSELFEN